MRDYYVSEGVKALFAAYLKEKTEESFFKALNEFSRENQINSQEIKDEALREIKEELSKLATTDLLNAKIDKVEASLNAKIDKVENKLDSFRTEVKTYVIILAVLMFIFTACIF